MERVLAYTNPFRLDGCSETTPRNGRDTRRATYDELLRCKDHGDVNAPTDKRVSKNCFLAPKHFLLSLRERRSYAVMKCSVSMSKVYMAVPARGSPRTGWTSPPNFCQRLMQIRLVFTSGEDRFDHVLSWTPHSL